METPAQMCVRLVTALEDLVAQEAATLQARDFAAAVVIQDRAAPLVSLLGTHGPAVADEALRARIAALLARRSQTGEWLSEQIRRVREELQRTEAAKRRVAQFAPVYSHADSPPRRQLSAVG